MDSLPLSDLSTTPSRTEAKSNSNGSEESSRLTRKALLEKTRRETRLHYIREFKQILLRTGAHQGSKLEEVNVLELTLKYINYLEHELESARKGAQESYSQGLSGSPQSSSATSSPPFTSPAAPSMPVQTSMVHPVFPMMSPMMLPTFPSPADAAAYQMYLNNVMRFSLGGFQNGTPTGSPNSSDVTSSSSSPASGHLSSTSAQSSPESRASSRSKSFSIASLHIGDEEEEMEEEEIDVITTSEE